MMFLASTGLGADSDGEDGTSIGINVDSACQLGSTELQGPGNNQVDTDISVVAMDEMKSFTKILYNAGNSDMNITARLNVTKVEDLWEPGDPKGNFTNLSQQNNTENVVNNTFYNSFNMSSGEVSDTDTWVNYIQSYYTDPAYGKGYFVGRMYLNYSCSTSNGTVENDTHLHDYANFRVLNASGSSGGVNTTGNRTAPPVPENVNRSGDEEAEIGNASGDKPTEVTQPEDVDQTGEESDEALEGDNPTPGQTPEPEPEPTPGDSPEPGESRQPSVQIDIEPVNNTYLATQGQFAPARLEIENIGDSAANNIEISPEIDQVRPGWGSRPAEVANLSVNETVTRDVFVQPPEDQNPGTYVVPVEATNGDRMLDLDYFSVKVNRSELRNRVEIQEAPESVTVTSNSSQPLPVLVQNTGETELTNVSAELQNAEDCGEVNTSVVDSVGINESASLDVSMQATSESQSCNATLIVSSDQGAYSFSNMEFTVAPEEGLIPEGQRAPFIAIIWTVVLAAYAVLRKKYELTSPLVKMPFIMLLIGETAILLYMVVNYYGLVSVSFLPF